MVSGWGGWARRSAIPIALSVLGLWAPVGREYKKARINKEIERVCVKGIPISWDYLRVLFLCRKNEGGNMREVAEHR